MKEICDVISSVGFPIFSFIVCAWFIKYTYDKSFEQLADLTKAVNNNTLVLTELVDKLRKEDD